MDHLNARAVCVQRELDGKEPKAGALLWLQNVENKSYEVLTMPDGNQDQRWCFNLVRSRLKSGEAIKEKFNDMTELLAEGRSFEGRVASTINLAVGGYALLTIPHEGTTPLKPLGQILELLNNENVARIGMGGIGNLKVEGSMGSFHG